MVTKEDLIEGRRHEDGICHVTFPVDIHNERGYDTGGIRSKPYDIPIRALMANDRPNLLLAGRCISGDHWAHASYRVTGDAVPMGEAAGTLAALAATTGIPPDSVPWTRIRDALSRE